MNPMRNLLAAATVVGLFGAAPSAQAAPSVLTDSSIPDVAERVVDSVVNIRTMSTVKGTAESDPFFTDEDSPGYNTQSDRQQMAKGSGVIVTASGRILTNSHVISGADTITVTLPDGSELEGKVIGNDPQADLAVVQLEGKVPALKPLPFGDSSAMRLGEVVLAIGDPLGVGKSVTMGIVSAKGRGNMGIEEYEDFIQTDAAINPGNSGGALVNLKGELIGINTAIASRTGGYSGIGFAIPTNMAQPIMEMLVKTGKVTRGYMGVTIGTATPEIATKFQLGASHGAVIGGVEPNGPAGEGGGSRQATW